MTLLQQVQLWAGLGFTVILVAFFIAAFFRDKPWNAGQWVIVRILASLSGAFSAALFTGSALLEYRQAVGSGGMFAFQGAAGFALFFLVWNFFPGQPAVPPPPPDDGNINLLKGMKFRDAATTIADKNLDRSRGVDFEGFTDAELAAQLLRDALINLKDGRVALMRLRDFTGDAVKPYQVTLKDDRYQMQRTAT